jgi:uridine kinase
MSSNDMPTRFTAEPATRKMKKPYLIAINSVSGGGKTALAKQLKESLPASVVFCFDDFDETNLYPEDFYEWWKRGADLEEFDCPGMAKAINDEIQRGACEFIIVDYPFGRDHPRFKALIDLSVFVDTPLDVAMARRIIRDYGAVAGESAAAVLDQLRTELAHYLEKARYPYLDTDRHKPGSDLILNGCDSLQELRNQVLERIGAEKKTL